MAFTQLGVLHFQPDIEPDKCALNNVHYRYRILDLLVYIRHAPARLRIAANMFALASGYAAVCLLSRLLFAEGATQAGCGACVRSQWNLINWCVKLLRTLTYWHDYVKLAK